MECEETRELIGNKAFLFTIYGQLAASFVAVVLNILVSRKCNQLYFHINTRILISAMLYLYIVNSVLIITLQAIHLFQYFSYQPCDIGVSPILCYSLRYPIASCMVACAALQVSMVIERGIALWKRRNYEHYGSRVGIALVIVSIIIGLSTILVVTSGITQKHPTSYCIINGIASPESIIIMKLTICVADLSALVGIATLYLLNKILLKRKSYDLQSSYQLFENTSVIRIILPLSICQTLFYVSFTISGTIVSFLYTDLDRITYITLTSATYTIPYYTVMSPILIWFTIRWSRQLKETKLKRLTRPIAGENDVYFKSYEEMWNKPPVRRS